MTTSDVFEPHRSALTGHCYRMLGSISDAEDAVQETMVRAWKGYEGFDGRSKVGTWLYRIATNVCIDQLRGRGRRCMPMEERAVGTVHDELVALPPGHWLEPVPDARVLPDDVSPERRAELRQSLRLAFVASLQLLPPRQRAALLLKDVLGFSAAEIAEVLETTPASINSALQRARKTLAGSDVGLGDPAQPAACASSSLSAAEAALVDRFLDAFHAYDIDALVRLLKEDGTMCMPPFTLWLEGRASVHDWMLGRGVGCRGSRLMPVAACGQVAFGQYKPAETGEGYDAWSLIVLELDGALVSHMTYFLDVERLFPVFGLAPNLPS